VIGSIVSLRQAMVANNALSLAVKESSRARKSEDQLRQALYASDMRLAALAWQRNDTRRAKDLLKRHVPGPGQNDLRGVEWSLLTRQIEISSREVLHSEKPLYVVKVSPSGQQIAAAGAAGTIWILDAATLEPAKTIDAGQSEINGLDFSPDGRELLSCGDDGTVCRWNVATGDELLRFRAHNDVAYNVLFGHEPNTCISCGRERVIRVWDSRDGSPVDRLNWHKDHVTSMVVSARGVLVAGGDDCSTSTWDLREYRKIHDYSERPSSKVLAVACSLDTALIATGDNEGYVWLRRANSGALLALQNLPDSVQALAFSPVTLRDEQTTLAAGDRAGFVHILPVSYTSAPSGLIRSDALTQSGRHWEAHRGRVYSTAFSLNGLQLFTAGEDGILKVWELDSRSSWPLATGVSEFAEIDAGKVVSAEGEAIQLHSPAETGYRTSRLGRLTAVRVEYAPLAQRIFIVDSEQKRLVRLDLEHLHEETVAETSDWIGSIAVTSDGASLAYETHADGHRNRQLHIVTQGKEHTFPLDWMSGSMAFAEDGHLLVPQEHDIRIYDAAAPRLLATLPVGRSGISDIRLSPDGVHLAMACGDRSIHVWNWRERRELWSEVAHARDITSVAFSPDGETIATAGKDPFLRLWRWKQGALVLEFPLGDWPVSELAFTRDGRRLLVNGNRFLRSYELAR
jgi:WD40 repeat protein